MWVRPNATHDERIEVFTLEDSLSEIENLAGVTLQGRYKLLAPLGVGGTAQVYRALDVRTGGHVAVKVLHPGAQDVIARFFDQECQLAARIVSPHLIHAIDRGEDEGRPFIVFELVEGRSLHLIKRMPWRELCQIVLQVLDALTALHRHGVVHRDVKPSNIYFKHKVGGEVHATLLDLGFARGPATAVFGDKQVFGTEGFIAPELLAGRAPEPRNDLYSLGATMYLLLTSFERSDIPPDSDLELPSTRAFLPSIPEAVDDIVMCALSDVDHRFVSAEKMATAIFKALRTRERSPGRVRAWVARAAVGGVSAGLVVAGTLVWRAGPATCQHAPPPLVADVTPAGPTVETPKAPPILAGGERAVGGPLPSVDESFAAARAALQGCATSHAAPLSVAFHRTPETDRPDNLQILADAPAATCARDILQALRFRPGEARLLTEDFDP